MQMLSVCRIVKLIGRTAAACILIEGIERSPLEAGRELRGPRTCLGRHIDHATDRIRAVQAALRTSQHFDALNVLRQKLTEVERAGGVARVAHIDAIDEHFYVIGVGAAYEDGCLAADAADLDEIQSGYDFEHVREGLSLGGCNIVGGNDRDA